MKIPEIELNLGNVTEELDSFSARSDGWYFRGQANSEWELLPSVWRKNIKPLFKKFCDRISPADLMTIKEKINNTKEHYQKHHPGKFDSFNSGFAFEWALRVKFEEHLLARYYDDVNKVGLPISDAEFHKCKQYTAYWLDIDFPHEIKQCLNRYCSYLISLSESRIKPLSFDGTLPQHHGLPTRYLDWTKNPRIALFFACYDYLKFSARKKKNIKNVAVYAIKEKLKRGPLEIEDHHLRHRNKFLHVQDGIFTYIHGDFYYLENGKWPSIEDMYRIHKNKFFEIKKYMLDVKHVECIMTGLNRQGISLASLMPSEKHVVEQIITHF